MNTSDSNGVAVILAAVAIGLLVFFIVLFSILLLILYLWFRRHIKAMQVYCQKERRRNREKEEAIRMSQFTSPPADVAPMPSTIPVPPVIRATNQTFSSSYENPSLPTSPTQTATPAAVTKAWSDSGQYTDVVGPLPAFLRNEEMLLAPTVSPEVREAAAREVKQEEPVVKKTRNSLPTMDDYVDPQDARNEAAAMRQHDKITKKVSKGRRPTDPAIARAAVSDRDDYTTVSDALPKGDFERVDMNLLRTTSNGEAMRQRTNSDTSPMLSHRSASSGQTGDSGKGSNGSPMFQKSHSMRKPEKPKHVAQRSPKSQPLHRRSQQQKEFVSFDPNTAGFKLTAKRTNSDGTPTPARNEGKESPTSDPGFVQGTTDEGFIEGGRTTHVYAAVDLTAKCRPEDDFLRREGVGAPEHYVAPVACN